MSATPDQLPNDIEEMKRLFLVQAANLEKLSAELTAAGVHCGKLARLDLERSGRSCLSSEL